MQIGESNISYRLLELLKTRKSCREFAPFIKGKPMRLQPKDFLRIDSIRMRAPYASGGPRYGLNIVVEPDEELKDICYNQQHVKDAWVIYCFHGKDTDTMLRSGHPKYIMDAIIGCTYVDIAAISLGYGTCWVGHFDPVRMKEYLNLSEDETPVILLLIGKKAENDIKSDNTGNDQGQ
jgi:nitroreductase